MVVVLFTLLNGIKLRLLCYRSDAEEEDVKAPVPGCSCRLVVVGSCSSVCGCSYGWKWAAVARMPMRKKSRCSVVLVGCG